MNADSIQYALETDSNLRIPESKFAKTPAWGGRIRTSASWNQIRYSN